jgi:predicted RNA binding protein YcfA (HicA-like mRNA interferase family)
MNIRKLSRWAKARGWKASLTNGGHVRLEHLEAAAVVVTSSTPSCCRTIRNLMAEMKRALKEVGWADPKAAPKPEPRQKRPKRPKPPPKSASKPDQKPQPQPQAQPRAATLEEEEHPRRRRLPGGPSGYVTTRW